MDYQEIIEKIIAIRDELEGYFKEGKTFKLKPLLDEIKDLADKMIIDNQEQLFDRISVYEYIAEDYEQIGRLQLALDCYDEVISCCKEIIDENREDYPPLAGYYAAYVSDAYMLTGTESKELYEEIEQYTHEEGMNKVKTTLEYVKTAPKHNPIEDSEEYLNVIDSVLEEVYNTYYEQKDDEDIFEKCNALKKKLLKEKYNIDWDIPVQEN